jgi:surface protein
MKRIKVEPNNEHSIPLETLVIPLKGEVYDTTVHPKFEFSAWPWSKKRTKTQYEKKTGDKQWTGKASACLQALSALGILTLLLGGAFFIYYAAFPTPTLGTRAPTGPPTSSPTSSPTLSPTFPTLSPTSSPTSTCQSSMSNVPLDTSTIVTARDLWFSNETDATATYGHISTWDTTAVTAMNNLFDSQASFNEDIGCWDTASVTNMAFTFRGASVFNQSIGSWDTGKVKAMSRMFSGTDDFNQNIGSWNTASVKFTFMMFKNATAFNQNIGSWNVAGVAFATAMFQNAHAFNAYCPHVEALCPWGFNVGYLDITGNCSIPTPPCPTR